MMLSPMLPARALMTSISGMPRYSISLGLDQIPFSLLILFTDCPPLTHFVRIKDAGKFVATQRTEVGYGLYFTTF